MKACTESKVIEKNSVSIYSKAVSLLLVPVRVLKARHDLAQLAHLSDHQLKDMGLTRSDLANAAARPLREDPTDYLANVRCERRKDNANRRNESERVWFKRTRV